MSTLSLPEILPANPAVVAPESPAPLENPDRAQTSPQNTAAMSQTRLWEDSLPPILVAEDDPDDAYFIQRFIRKTGIKNGVRLFSDGTEVVNFLGQVIAQSDGSRHRAPLLLFLDLKMAGLGGFGFLEWARAQKDLGPLTIVVLSTSNEPEDMARAMALGAHRYLVKYPSVATFARIIRSVYPEKVF
jgi:CheY-like chemotaxis protein